MKRCALLFLLFCASQAKAETVVCHIDYGGETRQIAAAPSLAPLTVPTAEIGSFFLFRLVFEARTAIKVYVYADRAPEAPLPLHQALYPWPADVDTTRSGGFTGLHYVYEPIRDGELLYWCNMKR